MRILARLIAIAALVAPAPALAIDPGKAPAITLGTGSAGDASGLGVTANGATQSLGTVFGTVQGNTSAIASEASRAKAAEGLLAPLTAVQANTSAITGEISRATAAEALLAPKASPVFTGTATIPSLALSGTGSTGDVSGMGVTLSPLGDPTTLAGILGRTGGTSPNFWYNPDGVLGDGSPKVILSDSLSIYGADRWQFQQSTMTPFVLGQTVSKANGVTAVRTQNGFGASGTNTIGTGSKTFATQAGLNFAVGFPITAVVSSDLTTSMSGTIAGYSGTTLTINVTSTTGSGTYSNWVVGKNGYTQKAIVKITTTAASAIGSTTLSIADTSQVEIGAPFEYGYDANFNSITGIQRGTYVVAKTANSITINLPVVQNTQATTGTGVQSGQVITLHGDQGSFVYQDIYAQDAVGFNFGTAAARDAYLSFDFETNISGRASVLMLGYNTGSTLGRTYAQSFSVVPGVNHITLKIKADTGGLDTGTWKVGYNSGLPGDVWAAFGFSLSSQGTATSQNIPVGVWGNSSGPGDPFFATAGSADQTFQLTNVVGAYADISKVNFTLDKPTPYVAPVVTQTYPTPKLQLLSRQVPILEWNAFGNPLNSKVWRSYPDASGTLRFDLINDANTSGRTLFQINPDNSVSMPGYGAGTLSVDATGKIGSTPGAFIPYNPGGGVSSPGATPPTFGTSTGRYRVSGKTMHVQMSIPITNNGTGGGAVLASLPTACNGFEWSLTGIDSTAGSGALIYARVPANTQTVQIRKADGSYPAVSGSTLNVSGFCELP